MVDSISKEHKNEDMSQIQGRLMHDQTTKMGCSLLTAWEGKLEYSPENTIRRNE